MLNLLTIALFQLASITTDASKEITVAQTPASVFSTHTVQGGTGGWGNDIAVQGGTGGWGNDIAAA